ncbi:hypothetical protein JCM11491_002915 [Sporobolomyces phaffii]
MSGTGHPLAGVGHGDRPTPFDQLSRVAMAHGQQLPSAPIASSSTSHPHQVKRGPASSNEDFGPSPPEYPARPNKKARKQDSGTSGNHEGELSVEGRKRSKQVLSCSECKRRKIKCDRCQPCSACVKRGAPNDCCWEDAKIEPDRQPFALSEDLDEMRERLVLLERFINKLPPALTTASFAELGIERMGMIKRESSDEVGRGGHQMFENLDTLDNGECTEMYNLPGECFPSVNRNSHDNLELLENALMIVTRDPVRRRVELTDALTSILAPPPVWVDASSATRLGLDLVLTEAEFLDERKHALEKIFRILPNKADSYKSFERYEKGFHWMFTCLHLPTLKAEHQKYWEMTEAGRRDEVDPAWLAVYTLVLALSWNDSSHLSPWMTANSRPESPEELARKERETSAFYAASQKLLLLADPQGRPQVRVMQCVMLTACWTVIAAVDSSDWGRFSNLLALAIRTGHTLQLHRLTDDPESMPADDPAWPPGKNSVKRENALRIWSALTFYDHLAAISRFSTYMIVPDHTTTPMLSNIDSNLLSPTEWKVEPQPDSIATDATLERHKYKLAEISRKTFDMYVTGKKSFNYGAILELDKEYRKILDSMPDTWLHEHKTLEEKDPFLRSRRFGALQSVHNRIVRLHRPFLTRGYVQGSRFAYSTEACIKSAKIVLFCHHNNVGFIIKPLYSHSLSASIVLAADLFHNIDIGTSSSEIESKKENLALALEIFSEGTARRVRSQHLKLIISQARRILSGLFLEVEKRRARKMARSVHGKNLDAAKEESFAEASFSPACRAKTEQVLTRPRDRFDRRQILARIAREDPSAPLAMNHQPARPASRGAGGPELDPNASYASSSDLPPVTAAMMDPSTSTTTLNWNGTFPGMTNQAADPSTEMFENTFLSDLGLLSSNGQLLDYYNPPNLGSNGANHNAAMYGTSSSASGSAGGPSPSDSFDLSFLGFGNGTNDGGTNGQDASQVLFNQLTAGW